LPQIRGEKKVFFYENIFIIHTARMRTLAIEKCLRQERRVLIYTCVFVKHKGLRDDSFVRRVFGFELEVSEIVVGEK
jgi:hypothetical protein